MYRIARDRLNTNRLWLYVPIKDSSLQLTTHKASQVIQGRTATRRPSCKVNTRRHTICYSLRLLRGNESESAPSRRIRPALSRWYPSSARRQRFLSPFTYEMDRMFQRSSKLSWEWTDASNGQLDWVMWRAEDIKMIDFAFPAALPTVTIRTSRALWGRTSTSTKKSWRPLLESGLSLVINDLSFSTFVDVWNWLSADSEVLPLPAWFAAMCYITILTIVELYPLKRSQRWALGMEWQHRIRKIYMMEWILNLTDKLRLCDEYPPKDNCRWGTNKTQVKGD